MIKESCYVIATKDGRLLTKTLRDFRGSNVGEGNPNITKALNKARYFGTHKGAERTRTSTGGHPYLGQMEVVKVKLTLQFDQD